MTKHVMSYRAMKRREALTAYAFILPTLVGFIVFIVGPMFASFAISLYEWNLLTPPRFVGTANFEKLFADTRIVPIYLTTFRLAIATVIGNMTLGLALALMLDSKLPVILRNFFRVSFFFPFVVSTVAVTLMWTFILNRDLGPLNYYLGLVGIERINWLNSSASSPWAIVLVDVWKSVGFYVVVFLAGLQSIAREYYEAAKVDGASGWQQFRHITLPFLSPTILFLSVISVIGSLQLFEQPQILTQGGPGDATRTIVLYIYEHAFRFFDMGYASTVAISLFVIILLLTLLQFGLSRRWVFYQ